MTLLIAVILLVHWGIRSPHENMVPSGEGLRLSHLPRTPEPRTVPST